MSSRPTPIEALAGNPATSGLVLDFDGVLSPIINDPAASRLPNEVAASLARLARTLGLLAVISAPASRVPRGPHTYPRCLPARVYGIEQIRDGYAK